MTNMVEIFVPVLGESVSEAIVARWLKEEGAIVKADDVIAELETDKITLEIVAPASGVLQKVMSPKGATVAVGRVLGVIEKNDSISAAQQVLAAPQMSTDQPLSPAEAIDLSQSPSVRKLLAEHHLTAEDISAKPGDRLTKESVLHHLSAPQSPSTIPPLTIDNVTKEWALDDKTTQHLEHRVPLSRLRQRISERLKEAQNTAAILTTFNEVDMSAIMTLRTRYKASFEKKHGIKLGFMSFFVKACVQALKEIPMVNAHIENDEIVHKNYYDIGVAISAPQGLVVPVVRDADACDLAGVEKAISAYAQKAKENKLSVEDLRGGSFTITNGGTFGSLLSTPILNPPQSAILGMHKIQDRPVAIDGHVEIRPMMYLALSYDHRLIDGREAVTFLVTIKECLENPGRFLLDL